MSASSPARAGAPGASAPAASSLLRLSAVCGFRPMLSTPVAWMSDGEVVFAAGPRTLVRLDLESRAQVVISSGADVAAVTAFALAPSRRALAVAEASLSGATQVVVYDWSFVAAADAPGGGGGGASNAVPPWHAPPALVQRRRRVLGGLSLGAGLCSALSFSRDSKFLAVVSGAPDAHVFLVEWAAGGAGRLAACARDIFHHAPAARVAALDWAPREPALLAASGPALLTQFRLVSTGAGANLVEAVKTEPFQLRGAAPSFTAHAWLPEQRFVAATAAGALWVFARSEHVATLAPPPAGNLPVACIAPLGTRGFVVGCDGGVLRLYEKSTDARELFCAAKGVAVLAREDRLGKDVDAKGG
jgi:hypothetical protein